MAVDLHRMQITNHVIMTNSALVQTHVQMGVTGWDKTYWAAKPCKLTRFTVKLLPLGGAKLTGRQNPAS